MSKQNITLRVDSIVLKEAKKIAIDDETSLSEWVSQIIQEAVRKRSSKELVKRRAKATLNLTFNLGGKALSRDQAHER